MIGPTGILALLMVTATPSVPSGYALASDEVKPAPASPEYSRPGAATAAPISTPDGGPSLIGAAHADDSEVLARYEGLQEENPFWEEKPTPGPGSVPMPPAPDGGDPGYEGGAFPPGELPSHEGGTPDAESFLDEFPWEGSTDAGCLDGCDCAEGSTCECGETAACTCGRQSDRSRGWLWGLGFEGFISQGVTINTHSPRDRSNLPVVFNDRSNDYQMNQLYLSLGRSVGRSRWGWDIGGQVDLLYGTDHRFTTARGLEVRTDLSDRWNSGRYGLAMPQAYMEVYAPWGNGLTMKLGHFYTILGYETVPAVENFFYSKSYAHWYGEPSTHTGFLGSTRLGDLNFHAGMTRGWDNWEDNNNDFAFLGGVDWTSRSRRTSIAFAIHVGREQDEPPRSTDVRTMYSLVVQHWLGERLQYVIQYDHGFDQHGAADGRDADWFGVNQYLYYTINCCWRAGLRCEWFRDEDDARIDLGTPADCFALSFGLNWMPTDLVTVRPEIRWDSIDPLGGGTLAEDRLHDQLLLACDAILRF